MAISTQDCRDGPSAMLYGLASEASQSGPETAMRAREWSGAAVTTCDHFAAPGTLHWITW
jgi:hypothetical protein